MTFAEMVEAVNSEALGYATLGVRASRAEIVSALNRAQKYVAGDYATYAHRIEDTSEVDPFDTELVISQATTIPADSEMGPIIKDAIEPWAEFNVDGTIEPSLPAYCHDAIVTWAAYLLLHPDKPARILAQYDRQIAHARRTFLITRAKRPVHVKDGYDPYRFQRSEY